MGEDSCSYLMVSLYCICRQAECNKFATWLQCQPRAVVSICSECSGWRWVSGEILKSRAPMKVSCESKQLCSPEQALTIVSRRLRPRPSLSMRACSLAAQACGPAACRVSVGLPSAAKLDRLLQSPALPSSTAMDGVHSGALAHPFVVTHGRALELTIACAYLPPSDSQLAHFGKVCWPDQ